MRRFIAMLGFLFVLAVGLAGGLALSHYYALDERIFEVLEDGLVPSLQDGSHAILSVLKPDAK